MNEYEPVDATFDRYFLKTPAEGEPVLQILDEKTAADLDLDCVFGRIDRTRSAVGRQWMYARLRRLPNRAGQQRLTALTEALLADPELSERCREWLRRLDNESCARTVDMAFDTHPRFRRKGLVYALAALSVGLICCIPFYVPALFALLPVYVANMALYFSNRFRILAYQEGVSGLLRCIAVCIKLSADRALTAVHPGAERFMPEMLALRRSLRRVRVDMGPKDDLTASALFLFELVKIAFNADVILYFRFIDRLERHRTAMQRMYDYVGALDTALAAARLLETEPVICRPDHTDDKRLQTTGMLHPLVEGCVPNSLCLEGKSAIVTGSNMSGKTTFIRAVAINAILAQALGICFAQAWRSPRMRIGTSIRISDDILQQKSYYLDEVLTVKRFVDAAASPGRNLFILDELFKGTNTAERIAAGKAVLAYLNTPESIVLISTHDSELASMLRAHGYESYCFCETIEAGKLTFDYRIRSGVLAAGNAIRILALYGYPEQIVRDALGAETEAH